MSTNHLESVLATKQELDIQKQQQNLKDAIKESQKHLKVEREHANSVQQKSVAAHKSLEEIDKVGEQKKFIAGRDLEFNQNTLSDLNEKIDKAEEKRALGLEQKSKVAHLASTDVKSARVRKELYDAIDESEKHMIHHEALLKAEMVEAQRADHLNAVREKQAHLQ